MKQRQFIGKKIDVNKLQSCADEFSFPEEIGEGENYYYDDGQYTKAEIFLRDFQLHDSYDNSGYNFYSLKVIVDGEKIIKLIRVGHCHMCGNEGSDDELLRFPHRSLEAEASEYMENCLSDCRIHA